MSDRDRATSERLLVSLPPALMAEVIDLARRLGCSRSQAVRFLVMEGLKVASRPDFPFPKD